MEVVRAWCVLVIRRHRAGGYIFDTK